MGIGIDQVQRVGTNGGLIVRFAKLDGPLDIRVILVYQHFGHGMGMTEFLIDRVNIWKNKMEM